MCAPVSKRGSWPCRACWDGGGVGAVARYSDAPESNRPRGPQSGQAFFCASFLPDPTSCSLHPYPQLYPLNPPHPLRPDSGGTSYSFNKQIHSTYRAADTSFWGGGGKWGHGSSLKLLTAEGPREPQLSIARSNCHRVITERQP